ncbi:MAG: SAM-dependent chlorinase/fluorinase [Gammaproteobacteria bacterium]|nr:SAM-dependent chlorinase/fluorinase [Gammaproteobacteria bacterium]
MPARGPMRGIVTLTTDFGLRDPYVAVLKGQLLRHDPGLQLIDVTHEITGYDPAEAGFWLERIGRYFPDRTVHLAVVDPGVGTARALVAVSSDRQFYLGPDNGLLAAIAERPGAMARSIESGVLQSLGIAVHGGPTFHGRDLLAPVAARLAAGKLSFEALGDRTRLEPGGGRLRVTPAVRGWRGTVVTIDSFGNLISNLESQSHVGSGSWAVLIRGVRARSVRTYGAAEPGELVALVNSWGLVEVAVVQGSAARRLGAERGDEVLLEEVVPDA